MVEDDPECPEECSDVVPMHLKTPKRKLMSSLKMRDLGELKTFAGIWIMESPGAVHIKGITQSKSWIVLASRMVIPFLCRSIQKLLLPRQDECPQDLREEYQEIVRCLM